MPQLFIICGPAGVGKSTYGQSLASGLKACLLDGDTVTEPVVRAGMSFGGKDPNDRDSEVYRNVFRSAVYDCLYATAAENLAHTDVILVGPFKREIRDPEWLGSLRDKFQSQVAVIFVTCDEGVRRERIRRRGNPRDSLKLRNWEEYLEGSDLRAPAFEHQIVRT